mmetsp:Transcript_30834/g.75622  ORF Transcript_30834/g.75622 Transcript_30834/m.75622 type:complete len:162 (-) Transcript_30834:1010-1495(-)
MRFSLIIALATCLVACVEAFPAALSLVPHLRAPRQGVSPLQLREPREQPADAVAVAIPIVRKLKEDWLIEAQWQTIQEIAQNVMNQYSGPSGSMGNTATLTRRVRTRDLLSKLFHLDLEEEGPAAPVRKSMRQRRWEASERRRLCKNVAISLQFRNGPPPK